METRLLRGDRSSRLCRNHPPNISNEITEKEAHLLLNSNFCTMTKWYHLVFNFRPKIFIFFFFFLRICCARWRRGLITKTQTPAGWASCLRNHCPQRTLGVKQALWGSWVRAFPTVSHQLWGDLISPRTPQGALSPHLFSIPQADLEP